MSIKPLPLPKIETAVVHERKHRVTLSQSTIDCIVADYLARLAGVEDPDYSYEARAEGEVPSLLHVRPPNPASNRVYIVVENVADRVQAPRAPIGARLPD